MYRLVFHPSTRDENEKFIKKIVEPRPQETNLECTYSG
jgi:hypothetical protein